MTRRRKHLESALAQVTLILVLLFVARPAFASPRNDSRTVSQTVTVSSDAGKAACYLARPADGKPAPGLMLVHEWWGLNDWVKRQADRFAARGYVALAVDLYRGEVASDAEHAHELMRGLTDERALADMRAAFAYLAGQKFTQGGRIGAIGWCMGGGFALKLAIAEPRLACTVVCYGRPVTDVDQLRRIKGPLLGIWGETDRGIDVPPFKKALSAVAVRAEHHVYPGAGHAFLNETNRRGYNRVEAEKAWKEIDQFLARNLSR